MRVAAFASYHTCLFEGLPPPNAARRLSFQDDSTLVNPPDLGYVSLLMLFRAFLGICLILLIPLLGACNRGGQSLHALNDRLERITLENRESSTEISRLRQAYRQMLDQKEKDFNAFADGVRLLNETSESIHQTMVAFADYKREYRRAARSKAPGTPLGDLALGSQTLRQAVITEVTDTHIHLRHTAGSTRVALVDAPETLQSRYGYDPSLDIVLKQATGTGTDWLLSAIDAAQHYAANQPVTSPPRSSTRKPATPHASTAGDSGDLAQFDPRLSDKPAWQRFSNFTGSYWAPLKNRKRVIGTVNSISTSYGSYFTY